MRGKHIGEIARETVAWLERAREGREMLPTDPMDPATPPGTWVRLHDTCKSWKDGKLALVAMVCESTKTKHYVYPGPGRWAVITQANTCHVQRVAVPTLPDDAEGWTAEFIEDASTIAMDPAAKVQIVRLRRLVA